MAQTPRERIDAALNAHGPWTRIRTSATSIFAIKATGHALYALFNVRTGQLSFATYDGHRIEGSDVVGQLVTKINAS